MCFFFIQTIRTATAVSLCHARTDLYIHIVHVNTALPTSYVRGFRLRPIALRVFSNGLSARLAHDVRIIIARRACIYGAHFDSSQNPKTKLNPTQLVVNSHTTYSRTIIVVIILRIFNPTCSFPYDG